jgi:hypothetical protein
MTNKDLLSEVLSKTDPTLDWENLIPEPLDPSILADKLAYHEDGTVEYFFLGRKVGESKRKSLLSIPNHEEELNS